MTKKEILTPFLLIIFGAAFLIVSFAVYISNGKSKKWINYKIKVGALLLSLSTTINTGCHTTTCYWYNPKLAKKWITKVEISKVKSECIKGKIKNLHFNKYCYKIYLFKSDSIVQQGLLNTTFSKNNEKAKFKVDLSNNLSNGKYVLSVYESYSDTIFNKKIDDLLIEIK